jgi:hypothetical protein
LVGLIKGLDNVKMHGTTVKIIQNIYLCGFVVLWNIVLRLVQHGQGDLDNDAKNTCEALDSALFCRIFNEKVKKLEGRKIFYSLGSSMRAEVLQHSIQVSR